MPQGTRTSAESKATEDTLRLVSDALTTDGAMVQGMAADGAAKTGNPVLVAGEDGINTQTLLTDTSGRPRMVGAADAGAAVAGSPVRIGASDSGTTRDVACDSSGRLLVAQPTAADLNVTEASAADIKAAQDKIPGLKKTGNVANYAGVEIEVTGLTASTRYLLRSITMRLTGGTVGNTTQPSIGEATGFAQGDMDDRYEMSAAITRGDDRTVDTLVQSIPVWSDANGKLYIKGASPAVADSTLYWRVDLDEARTGA